MLSNSCNDGDTLIHVSMSISVKCEARPVCPLSDCYIWCDISDLCMRLALKSYHSCVFRLPHCLLVIMPLLPLQQQLLRYLLYDTLVHVFMVIHMYAYVYVWVGGWRGILDIRVVRATR